VIYVMEDGGRGDSFPLTLVPYNSLTVAVEPRGGGILKIMEEDGKTLL